MVMVASRRRLPSVVLAGALVVLASAVWWQATPAHADDVTVVVRAADGGQYSPAEVTIEWGDAVTWVWEDDGHSVTHRPEGDDGQPLFDSHPDAPVCAALCGREGDEFAFSDFPEPGTYAYGSKMNPGMLGTVVVRPAAEPSPAEPSPSSEPSTSEPSTSATSKGERSPKPQPTGAPPPEPETESESEPAPAPAPRQQAAPPSVERASARAAPAAGSPSVANDDVSPSPVPEPSFEEFPQATDPTDGTDVLGEVALGGTDDGGATTRTVWALVGGASVLGTLGAFARTLLLSDAWDG